MMSSQSKAPDAGDQATQESFINLVFTCEDTGKPVEYEVPSDLDTVRELWARELSLTCPHCRQVHRLAFRTAFIEGVLAQTATDAHEWGVLAK